MSTALTGRYALQRELGRGGMATVYLAHELKHDRDVALKVLRPELAASLGPERFLREIRLTARLDHPHILPVLDSGEDAGLLWYTMPYVRGESLRDRLRTEIQLPIETALDLTRQIASALHSAHREGVVHRDLKPENILLADGEARVADFGVARALTEAGDHRLTETGLAVGTPVYMSPEQASGGSVDQRSDIYSLGCVLFEMLVGEPPYTGPTPQAITVKRMTDPVPSVRRLRDVVPQAVDDLVTRALAKVPADRFRTAAELQQAVARAVAGAASDSGRGSGVSPSPRRSRTGTIVLGLAVVLTVGGLVAALWHRRGESRRLDPDLLAVAPFDVLDPRLQLWREGMVDLLARNLDGAGPLRTVPPTAVMRRWAGHADPLSAADLGRRTGARLAVFGSLVPAGGDSTRLQATLFDVATGRALAELELRDQAGRVDRLGDSLAVKVLGELGRARRIELTRVASLGSTSPPALKAFLQGEQWFRRAAWDSALANYERAVALDSSFALALWRLGRTLGWQRIGFDSLATALSLRAGALNNRLAPRDSLLVSVDSIMFGDTQTWATYRRLLATATEAVRRYPDDADAWHTLGEVQNHRGRRVSIRDNLASFDRAIALDSSYAPAYIHAIECAAGLYGLEGARRYAQAYLSRAEDVTAEGIRLAFDVADPTRGGTAEVRERLEHASANVLLKAWLPVSAAVDSAEVALRIARAFASSPESSAEWLPGSFRRAALSITLVYRGHLREAGDIWRPDLFFAPKLLAELALMGAVPPDSAETHFGRWLDAGELEKASAGLVWWAASGDTLRLRRFHSLADSLTRSSEPPEAHERAVYAVAAAEAYLTLARRDSVAAVRRFEQLPDSLCEDCPMEALTRIRLWAAHGEDRRALEEAEPWVSSWTAVEVMRRLEGARAAERLNQRQRAIADYQFVADAWRHADRELQPFVVEAREALRRLSSETGS